MLLVTSFAASVSYAEPLRPVELGDAVIDLADSAEITMATPQEYTPERVRRERTFEPFSGYVDGKEGNEAVYWLRFSIHNPTTDVEITYLSMPKGYFWRARLYEWEHPDEESILIGEYNRLTQTFGVNAIYPSVTLPLTVAPGETVRCYLMVKAYDIGRISPRLLSERAFSNASFALSTAFGVAYGLVVGLSIYAMLLLPVLRNRGGIVFVVFHVASLAYLLLTNGFSFTVFGGAAYTYINFSVFPGLCFLLFALALAFACRFSRVHTVSRRIAVAMWLLVAVTSINAVLLFAGDPITDVSSIVFTTTLASVFTGATVVIVRSLRSGNATRLLLACAWLPYTVALFLAQLHSLGVVVSFAPYVSLKSEQIGLMLFIGITAAGIARYVHEIHRSREVLRVARIAAERRAKDAESLDQQKTRFLANVTHELRTPLTSLRIPIDEIVARRYGNSVDADDPVFAGMLRQIDRISRKISSLLTHARIGEHLHQVALVDTDLGQLVGRYAAEIIADANTRDVRVSSHLPAAGEARALIDSDLFDSIMVNLLDNALRYTPAGGEIEIAVSRRDGIWTLQISNTGEHIPENMLDRVFERGVSLHKNRGENGSGSGIGLSVAKKATEAMGGSIAVVSEPGGRTSFTVTFNPHVFADESDSVGSESHRSDSARRIPRSTTPHAARRLLLVEDDRELSWMLSAALEPEFQVTSVNSGEAAIEAVGRERFDLVISDIIMPGIDGISLLTRVRADSENRHIPCIFLSAKSDPKTEAAGFDAGAVAYLVKPVPVPLLRRRIRTLINHTDAVTDRVAGDITAFLRSRQTRPVTAAETATVRGGDRLERIAQEYGLTARQTAVLQLLLKGYTSGEIGALLEISTRTVDNHVQVILQKVGVSRRSQLRYDLLEEDPGL